jgi:hypothetical protein
MQDDETKGRLDELTDFQPIPSDVVSNGHVTGQHAGTRSKSEGGGGGVILIQGVRRHTGSQTSLN